MRLLAAAPLLLLAACQASEQGNETVIQLNAEKAENTADALLGEAERAAQNAGERFERVADKVGAKAEQVGEEIDKVDVDVDVDRKGDGEPPANAQ